jgi:hypothetical protein
LVFRQRKAAPIFSGATKTSPGHLFHHWPAHRKRFVSIFSRSAGTSSPPASAAEPDAAAVPAEVAEPVEPLAWAVVQASAAARAWAVAARLVGSAAGRPASVAAEARRALRQVW